MAKPINAYSTMAHVGYVGQRAYGATPFRMATWLCPHCSSTHVTIVVGDADDEGAMELNFKMDDKNAEEMARQFLNPTCADPDQVEDVRGK